jgi:hypothetical protein
LEEELIGRITAADASLTRERASALLRRWLLAALEDDASTETPAGGRQEAGDGGGGAVGSEVNGAVLDARSPQDLLLADDRCAAACISSDMSKHVHSVWSLSARMCCGVLTFGTAKQTVMCCTAFLSSWQDVDVSERLTFTQTTTPLARRRVLQWAASSTGRDFVAAELRSLAAAAKARQVQQLAAPTDGGECDAAPCEDPQAHHSAPLHSGMASSAGCAHVSLHHI